MIEEALKKVSDNLQEFQIKIDEMLLIRSELTEKIQLQNEVAVD